MPRPRQYADPAERQAAHRRRREEEQACLRAALYRLDAALWDAGDRGDPMATACRAPGLVTMLTRLAEMFEGRSVTNDLE